MKEKHRKITKYVCPHCGEKFKYRCNQDKHKKSCDKFFDTPNKYKEVIFE